ncbi:UNVERIFIED_CONTAM: hypothetical protein Sradi_5293700 [Sesamum radiatum]|uniref:Uncharacterized protein n=1 Tax=Sesamum radiatum TaxID=300843 RepID=A0AAW2LPK4_SESRA
MLFSRLEEYVDECYSKTTYLKVYEEMIHAVPRLKDYIKTDIQPLQPPKMKIKRGRPQKLRRKGSDELQNTSTRKGLTHTCKNCFQVGHNKHTCKKTPYPASKNYKRPSTHDEMTAASQEVPPLSQEDVLGSQPRMTTNNNATSNEQVGYQGRRNAALLGKRQKVGPSSIPASTTPPTTPEDVSPIAVTNTIKWTKKPTISEVFENIRKNSKNRGWKS